jgi:hypothetical protein
MKTPTPRPGSFMGMGIVNRSFPDGSWLEGEEFAYPNGGFTRRAYAWCEDGRYRVFKCSIADTFFSIPARGVIRGKRVKGFLTCTDNGMEFTQT